METVCTENAKCQFRIVSFFSHFATNFTSAKSLYLARPFGFFNKQPLYLHRGREIRDGRCIRKTSVVRLCCVKDLDLENSCLTERARNGGRINEVAEHAQTHFPVFLMSLTWTVSTPSLLPCKYKHHVIAESLAPLDRSNLGTD